LFNSDFSGDVKVNLRMPEGAKHPVEEVHGYEAYAQVSIPGEAFERLLWTMIDYKLGDLGDDVAKLILDRLKERA